MTNAEKFKAVFGIDFSDFNASMLNDPYGKLKKYNFVLKDRFFGDNKIIDEGYVYAKSKKIAREIIIDELGDEYPRYSSEYPVYSLFIEEAKEK